MFLRVMWSQSLGLLIAGLLAQSKYRQSIRPHYRHTGCYTNDGPDPCTGYGQSLLGGRALSQWYFKQLLSLFSMLWRVLRTCREKGKTCHFVWCEQTHRFLRSWPQACANLHRFRLGVINSTLGLSRQNFLFLARALGIESLLRLIFWSSRSYLAALLSWHLQAILWWWLSP